MGEQNNETPQVVETQQQSTPQVVVVSAPATKESNGKSENAGLFTQEQLNAIVSSRVNNLNQKVADLTQKLADANASVNTYKAQVEDYQNKEVAKSMGIADEFVEFAIFNAKKSVSDSKPFKDALKEYADANKQFLHIPEMPAGNNGANPVVNNSTKGMQPTVPQSVRNLNTNGGQPQSPTTDEASIDAFLKARRLVRK